ncbi:MAG: hypothetical protein ACYTEQ_16870 [Planctomycetota bacterium]|jgi:hypothetical protein
MINGMRPPSREASVCAEAMTDTSADLRFAPRGLDCVGEVTIPKLRLRLAPLRE